ncbi:hypothetical protein [Granulosicoccus antarcticus]|uniref:Uncharacterized protein n=1 Tax=Granulosicoccus antarcticus IMCC3135 TaxID=1192854 RepID=A0A2Z2NQ36_9GAMM|nr:hypothetical protein [Granulosicoccus antarcticus]ASJ72061.1 hypothetical protein IMCC3135_09835 [Granulosicoccus antarcticus IMCC3135]
MTARKLLTGFLAGFIATFVFHQLAVAILAAIGLSPFGAWNFSATAPLGIPAVLSLSFWGGIWGIIMIMLHQHFGQGTRYWLSAFLFGGIVTSVVALFIVVPMKGGPLGGGFAPALLLTVFIINGVWGIAAAWLFRVFGKMGAASTVL